METTISSPTKESTRKVDRVISDADLVRIETQVQDWKGNPDLIFKWAEESSLFQALILDHIVRKGSGRSGAQNAISAIRLLSSITENLLHIREQMNADKTKRPNNKHRADGKADGRRKKEKAKGTNRKGNRTPDAEDVGEVSSELPVGEVPF